MRDTFLYQEVEDAEDARPAGGRRPIIAGSNADAASAEAAAAEREVIPRMPRQDVQTPSAPVEFDFLEPLPEEEDKGDKPEGVGSFMGTITTPPSETEMAALQVGGQALKDLQYNDTMRRLSLYADNEQMMADAAEMYAADHAAADETINRGLAKYRARTEQLDRDLERYRTQRIEPNEIFADMTAAGRFAAALNVAVGQMAATASGGPNAAMQLVNAAIDRNIAAQEANRRAALNATIQGRGLRTEEFAVMQEEIAMKDEQRARAMAYMRQQIALKMSQARSAGERERLAAADQLAAMEQAKAQIRARDARVSFHIKSLIRSGARLAQIRRMFPQILATQEAINPAQEMAVPPPANIPLEPGGPRTAAEAPQMAQATQPPATPTEAAMGQRRQRRAVATPGARVETAPEMVEEPPTAEEAAPMAEESAEVAGMTSPEGTTEVVDVTAPNAKLQEAQDENLRPAQRVKAAGQAIVEIERALDHTVAGNPNLVRPKGDSDAAIAASQNEARRRRDQWVANNPRPTLSPEEKAQLSEEELAEYQDTLDRWDHIRYSPELWEAGYMSTSGDRRNIIPVPLARANNPSQSIRQTYRLTQTSPLRTVKDTKLDSENDPERKFRNDWDETQTALQKASDAAELVEEFGIPGRVQAQLKGIPIETNFRVTVKRDKSLPWDDPDSIDVEVRGVAEEDKPVVIQKMKELQTQLLSLAAAFVKEFDPTSRLSDQDMKIAMQALGISDFDAWAASIVNAGVRGESALIKGYADFLRAYGEKAMKNFQKKAITQYGVMIPREDTNRISREFNERYKNIRNREN